MVGGRDQRSLELPVGAHVHKITYGPLNYTVLYICNVFDAGKSITRAI